MATTNPRPASETRLVSGFALPPALDHLADEIERSRVLLGLADDWDDAEQVICATGFGRGYREDPLLRALAGDHGLDTVDGWIVLEPDAAVGGLCDATRTLAIAGVAAQWAYPAADTLVGMKYVARRFLDRSRRCRTR